MGRWVLVLHGSSRFLGPSRDGHPKFSFNLFVKLLSGPFELI